MTVPAAPVPLIDVHAHYVTDSYLTAAIEAGHQKPDGMPGWPRFSVIDELAMMDRQGIGRAVLSISSPSVHFGDDRSARGLASEVNDFGANVVADYPDRFGLFTSLPLPDLRGRPGRGRTSPRRSGGRGRDHREHRGRAVPE